MSQTATPVALEEAAGQCNADLREAIPVCVSPRFCAKGCSSLLAIT